MLGSRRRWGRAVLGVLLVLVGGVGVAWPRVSRIDWVRRAPSFVLVRLAEDTTPAPAPTRLYRIQGHVRVTPGIPASGATPSRQRRIVDEIWARYEEGSLSLGQKRVVWRKRYRDGKSPVSVFGRSRWPEGVPLRVRVDVFDEFPAEETFRVTPRFPGARQAVSIRAPDRDGPFTIDPGWARSQPVGMPPAGCTAITFDVVVEEDHRVVWSGTTSMAVAVGGSLDAAMPPAVDGAITSAVVANAVFSVALNETGVRITLPPDARQLFKGVAIALRVEVRRRDQVIGAGRMTWVRSPGHEAMAEHWHGYWPIGLLRLPDARELMAEAAEDPDAWTLRFIGDGEGALGDFEASSYWAGEFEIPLDPARR